MERPNDKTLVCKNHNLVAFEICLHGSPMKHRLLCKICKQNLSKEELLEVISLTDFISGNFLTVLDSMIKQTNSSVQASTNEPLLEEQINIFFEKIEESAIKIIRKAKEAALKIVRESKGPQDSKAEIDDKRKIISTHLDTILQNWDKNLYDDELINNLAKCYSELTKTLTDYLNKTSVVSKNKEIVALENLNINGKNFDHFKKMYEKHLNTSIQKLIYPEQKENPSTEGSSKKDESNRTDHKHKKKNQMKLDQEEDTSVEKKVEKKVKTSTTPLKNSTNLISEIYPDLAHILEDSNKSVTEKPKIKCYHTLPSKHDYVFWGSLCYNDTNNHLISGGSEGNIIVWDVETKNLLYTRNIGSKVYKIIYIKPRGSIIVTSDDGLIHVYDVIRNYSFVASYQVHATQAFSAAYLSKPDLIASCGEDGDVIVWNYDTEKNTEWSKKRIFDTNKKSVSSLCYVEDLDVLITGMLRGGHLMIFQPERSKSIKVVRAHQKERSVDSIVYIPEWKQIVTGSEDSCIKFWEFSDISSPNFLNCLQTLRRDNSYIESLAIIPEKKYLFHTNLDDCFSVWDLSKDKLVENIQGHTQGQRGEALIYLKNKNEIVTAFTEEIRFWKIEFN